METFSDIAQLSTVLEKYIKLKFVNSIKFSETKYDKESKLSNTKNGRRWTYKDEKELIHHTLSVYFFDDGRIGVKKSKTKLSRLVEAAIDNNLSEYKKHYINSSEKAKFNSFQYAIINDSIDILEHIYSDTDIKLLFYNMHRPPQSYCIYNNSKQSFKYILQFDEHYQPGLLGEILQSNQLDFLKFLIHENRGKTNLRIDGQAEFIIANHKNPKYPHYSNETVEYWTNHMKSNQ